MPEVNSEDIHVHDSVAAAQLEKLNLEIEHLKDRKGWDQRIGFYTPLISVLIAVGGFLFGIYQFQRQQQIQQNQLVTEQQKERLSREADRLLEFKLRFVPMLNRYFNLLTMNTKLSPKYHSSFKT